MKTFAKFISFIATTVTVLAILAALPLTVPKLFHITPYVVLSGSMEPVIHTGALAYINGKDTDVEVGDIITYKLKNADGGEVLVTHRISRIENGEIIMKGDANDNEDFVPITQDQVVGTFMFSVPLAGYAVSKIAQPKVLVVAAVWLLLLNIGSFAINAVFANDDEEKEEKEGKAEDAANAE